MNKIICFGKEERFVFHKKGHGCVSGVHDFKSPFQKNEKKENSANIWWAVGHYHPLCIKFLGIHCEMHSNEGILKSWEVKDIRWRWWRATLNFLGFYLLGWWPGNYCLWKGFQKRKKLFPMKGEWLWWPFVCLHLLQV